MKGEIMQSSPTGMTASWLVAEMTGSKLYYCGKILKNNPGLSVSTYK